MCPQVFDDGPHDISGGADHLIPQFQYLNRSNRDEAERVRSTIEDFYSRYPASSQVKLRTRLRSDDDTQHLGAAFELIMHELLLRGGCQIISVEPTLEGARRSPDFLAETPEGMRFYLEATVATGRSRNQEGGDRRLREAIQEIDRVQSPDYFLNLHVTGYPQHPVSVGRLRREVEGWLTTLDYEFISTLTNRHDTTHPEFIFEQHGAEFRITVIPRQLTRGTNERGRAIAGRMLAPLSVQPGDAIRAAVTGKAGRYGELGMPYVVAVNALSTYAHEDDVIQAMFGTEVVSVRQTENGFEERLSREADGVWFGPGGPVYTRVSAVISTERLGPWSLGQRRARMIFNPWAQWPLPASPLGNIDIAEVRGEHLHRTSGSSIADLLDLPLEWPE